MNISLDYNDNLEKLDQLLGIGQAFDISTRDFTFLKENVKCRLYFMPFLIDSSEVTSLFLGFYLTMNKNLLTIEKFDNANILTEKSINEVVVSVFEGLACFIVDGSEVAYIVDVRSYPNRSIAEPETEKVVRGSRDGFNENFATNIALIRRRIKSGNLATVLYKIGSLSKTKVALVYLTDYVDQRALTSIQKALNNVKITELTMSDKALEEVVIGHKYSPYPLVRYTERPDTFVSHLYQGMFGLIVDTSPSAILAPVSIFDHMQHAEEFRQTPIAGTYLRILRFMGILSSFLLLPLWYMCIKMGYTPFNSLIFEVANTNGVFLQILLIEVGIELLRMASIHTPNALSTSMGLIAGIVIGNIAIDLGIFSQTIVFLGSISAIGTYITPSYELGLANKIVKIILLILIAIGGIWGLLIGLVSLLIYLTLLKSFDRSYLYPLIPFNFLQLVKQIIRVPYQNKHPKD